jgi:hypothetical protein
MAIKFLPFHNELVSNLATDKKQNDFQPFYIIQYAQVPGAKFELGQRIWSEALDRTCWGCWLLSQARQNRCLHNTLITNWK